MDLFSSYLYKCTPSNKKLHTSQINIILERILDCPLYTRVCAYLIYYIENFPLAFLNSTRKSFSGYLALSYQKIYYLRGIRLKHRRYEIF